VQHKDGTLLVGRIVKVTDTLIEMHLKSGGKVTIEFKNLLPYSVYRVKADRIDPASAKDHFGLGEWCLANVFYGYAVIEFDKAAFLDKDLADKAKKKREEAFNEDARTKFEEAKRLCAAKDYKGAEKLLNALLTTYRDTPWAKEAQTEMAKVADEIKKENEAKKKLLDDQAKVKADVGVKKAEDVEKSLAQITTEAIEDARKTWGEGLEWEGKANLTKADRAFKTVEGRLATARRHTEQLAKSNDVNVIKQAKDLDKEIDVWLVKTYYRLGRMWAVELNYPEAMSWLNKGLKMAPDDHLLNEVLLTLTQMEMRKRAAGGKY
jgi:tetratricopeptide (TPR) repeat protein